MKEIAPFLVVILALIATVVSILGEDGYSHLLSLRSSLAKQNEDNLEAKEHLDQLHRQVRELKSDPRAIEKSARDELGMARPNELIFIFKKGDKKSASENQE